MVAPCRPFEHVSPVVFSIRPEGLTDDLTEINLETDRLPSMGN